MTDETKEDSAVVPTNKGGPPRIQIDLDVVRDLASLGLTQAMVASRMGFSIRTFGNRMKESPEFREAYESGLAQGVQRAAEVLSAGIMNGDIEAAKFFLRARGGFAVSAAQTVVVTPPGSAPVIDGHVLDLAAKHSALLDSPDPDSVPDAEWSEVADEPSAHPADEPTNLPDSKKSYQRVDEPTAEELAELLA